MAEFLSRISVVALDVHHLALLSKYYRVHMLFSNPKFDFEKQVDGVKARGKAFRYDFIHRFNLDMDGTDTTLFIMVNNLLITR